MRDTQYIKNAGNFNFHSNFPHKKIAENITKPETTFHKEYELDEMKTFIGCKKNQYWIAYAIRKDARSVTDFRVGKRTNKTLRGVVETLLISKAKKIYTDGLELYHFLIPHKQHSKKLYKKCPDACCVFENLFLGINRWLIIFC